MEKRLEAVSAKKDDDESKGRKDVQRIRNTISDTVHFFNERDVWRWIAEEKNSLLDPGLRKNLLEIRGLVFKIQEKIETLLQQEGVKIHETSSLEHNIRNFLIGLIGIRSTFEKQKQNRNLPYLSQEVAKKLEYFRKITADEEFLKEELENQ